MHTTPHRRSLAALAALALSTGLAASASAAPRTRAAGIPLVKVTLGHRGPLIHDPTHWESGAVRVFTYAERPDLAARTDEVEGTLPEFTGHGEVVLRHWHKLRQELPELQLVLWDEERDRGVGHARTLPAREAEGLPGGIDDMLAAWFGGARPEPDVLSAMVAVVDRSGTPQVMLRDRFAGAHTPSTAMRKAWTATSFHSDTLALAQETQAGKPQSGVRFVDNAVMVGGGVLVEAAGSMVGAVGVSGTPTGEQDDACAKAGIAAEIAMPRQVGQHDDLGRVRRIFAAHESPAPFGSHA